MTATDLDARLQLVADRQRRCILQYVRNRPKEPIAVDELVDAVSHSVSDDRGGAGIDRDRIAVQLSHVHLPKCAEHGVIDYDRETSTVRYTQDDRIESLLDSVNEDSPAVSY